MGNFTAIDQGGAIGNAAVLRLALEAVIEPAR